MKILKLVFIRRLYLFRFGWGQETNVFSRLPFPLIFAAEYSRGISHRRARISFSRGRIPDTFAKSPEYADFMIERTRIFERPGELVKNIKNKKRPRVAGRAIQWDGMDAFFFDCAPIGFSGKTLGSEAKKERRIFQRYHIRYVAKPARGSSDDVARFYSGELLGNEIKGRGEVRNTIMREGLRNGCFI